MDVCRGRMPGRFYGSGLFIVIDGFRELAGAFVTKGKVAGNDGTLMRRLFKKLRGLAFADKDFISESI
jgi:hypothetical protein